MLQRAVDIWRSAVGSDHPGLAQALINLANVRLRLEDYAGSERDLREAVAIEERLHAEHPTLALALINLGSLLADQGRVDEGFPILERGQKMVESTRGPDHPDRTLGRAMIGIAHLARGDAEAAAAALEDSWARRDEAFSLTTRSELPHIAFSLARALRLGNKDPDRAEALAREALRRLDEQPASSYTRRQRREIEAWLQPTPAP